MDVSDTGGHSDRRCAARSLRRAIIVALILLSCGVTVALLHAAYSAYSWQNFHFMDYGQYTNVLWNSAHGQLFRFLVHRSYLKVHLSFTLALLAPLFRIWDHPFLPALLQWIMLVTGAAVVRQAGARHGLGAEVAWALTFFLVAYPFTQSVMLSEFHGVALYYLLVPWLYYVLCFRAGSAWLPLVLLLGTREDAFLVALPILLYFAVKTKSRKVYAMAGLALLYGLVAIFVLYPLINGVSLFAFRASWLPAGGGTVSSLTATVIRSRVWALVWVFLPAALLLRGGWVPVVSFVCIPLFMTLASRSHYQYSLCVHYSAAVMVCLSVGLVEAAHRTRRASLPAAWRPMTLVAFIVFLTVISHFHRGFLRGGGSHSRVYGRIHPDVRLVRDAARRIPREGILLCPEKLTPFCANRADLLTWKYLERDLPVVEHVFLNRRDFVGRYGRQCRGMLRRGDFGVRYSNGSYVVLGRGYDERKNAQFLADIENSRSTTAERQALDGNRNRNMPSVQ